MKITKNIIFISFILALLYLRTFIWLLNSWLTDPYYSHGFLIPIISGFIVWRNIRKNKNLEPEPFKFLFRTKVLPKSF